ncbi:MAG: phenylacetate--CoA ligase family protein, partial [Verrucomicrobiales bacterium]|nr:phenylacetate--CoA ligase family protein [Verrucomicrobiales bacterium]
MREELEARQLEKLQRLVGSVLDSNAFYQDKFSRAGVTGVPVDVATFRHFPFTRKSELVKDRVEQPPYGSNLTYPFERYSRFCQTSGTVGDPLPWLDTDSSWSAMLDC